MTSLGEAGACRNFSKCQKSCVWIYEWSMAKGLPSITLNLRQKYVVSFGMKVVLSVSIRLGKLNRQFITKIKVILGVDLKW